MKLKKAPIIVISIFALVLIAIILQRLLEIKDMDKYKNITMPNCLQLKIGMNRDEVKAIMGEPKSVQDSEFEGVVYEDWVFDVPITVSVPPMCRFDKEKGTLERIDCGEI